MLTSSGRTSAISRQVISIDGTVIDTFVAGHGFPLILLHGAVSDHTTWRTLVPHLAQNFRVIAIARRGRAGIDPARAYAFPREVEDVCAVVDLAVEGAPGVALLGHSFGGLVALHAARTREAILGVIVLEGAPPIADATDNAMMSSLETIAAEGDPNRTLAAFMSSIVGMSREDLGDFRRSPDWPSRARRIETAIREARAAREAGHLKALTDLTKPVLQLVGELSPDRFRRAAEALNQVISNGQIGVIEGARHNAHISHASEVAGRVTRFLRDARVYRRPV